MQTKLLLLFLLAGAAKSFGQIAFQENIVVGNTYTTYRPQLVAAADVDGDNDLDIITYGEGLNWYENDGLGNFGEKKVVVAGTNGPLGTSLYMVDFDNDGDLDILGSLNNKFTTYKNTDGLGNYQVNQSYTVGINSSTPVSTAAVDMDGDGYTDILCSYVGAGISGQPLVWYKNSGNGTFGAEQPINNDSAMIGTTLLVTKDLDGDGDQDIIIGNKSYSKIAWLKNTGNATFNAPVTISTAAGEITAIATSDIDNDGDMDIVSSTAYDNQVVWYKNLDGLGTFSDENIILSDATGSNSVWVTNIDNNNTPDIIYTKTNEIGWLNNAGAANFGPAQLITTKAFGVRAVITADLDGDGKKDLISASGDDDKVAWYKNLDGNGTFGRQVVISRSIEFPSNVYPGDFDGDNDIDLLVNSHDDAKLTWFENVNGLGFYGRQHIVTESVTVGNITPVSYPADLDGDGDLDIATCKAGILLWYENTDGQGNFTEHPIDATSSATIIRSKDMDGDGRMDLVCGVYNSNKFSWYKNLGNGTFGSEQVIADSLGTNGTLISMEIADMDGDGDMDLIGTSFNETIWYYKNTNGLGNFVNQPMSVFDNIMMAVYPADMDGDGDKDIVAVSENGGGIFEPAVIWYENDNGQGIFTTRHDISTLDVRGNAVHVADIDQDGDMDVFTSGRGEIAGSGRIAMYRNNGDGTFAARQIIQETSDYTEGTCIATADVDADNDLDVVSVFGYFANWRIGKVSVFQNLGDPLAVTENGTNAFSIYPNPTTGVININGNTMIDKVSLFDLNGRLLKEFRLDTPGTCAKLDITDLAKGIYLMKTDSHGSGTTKKIVKR